MSSHPYDWFDVSYVNVASAFAIVVEFGGIAMILIYILDKSQDVKFAPDGVVIVKWKFVSNLNCAEFKNGPPMKGLGINPKLFSAGIPPKTFWYPSWTKFNFTSFKTGKNEYDPPCNFCVLAPGAVTLYM